jgi:hypothetical protein
MPNKDRLPPGPRRELVKAVHRLYELAGKPATRKISAGIRGRVDLPGTLSHEGVSAVLRGAGGVPRWPNLESLVRVLAERAVVQLDVHQEVLRVHALWATADGTANVTSADTLAAMAPQASDNMLGDVGLASSQYVSPLVGEGQDGDCSQNIQTDLQPQASIPLIPAVWNPRSGTVEFKLTSEIALSWITNPNQGPEQDD